MRGEMSGRRRRAREGAHPLVRNRTRAEDDAPLARPAPNMQVRFGGFGLTTAGIQSWRGLGASARLGWQVSSNWTSPGVFLVYSVLRPISAALILTVIYQVITRGRASTYLAFLITGTAFWSFVQQGLSGFANAILDDRGQYRMLKYIYIAPLPFGVYLVGRAIAQLAGAAASAVIVIGLGTITLHLPINPLRANWLLLVVAWLLAFAAIVAIGMAFTFLLLAGRDTHGYGEIGPVSSTSSLVPSFRLGSCRARWRRSRPCR